MSWLIHVIIEWQLTHWGRVTHICLDKLTTIGSDNGLSPGRRQAIIWTNAGILLIGLLGTNVSEILIKIHTFSFKKTHLKIPFAKWRPFCLRLNELNKTVIGVGHGWAITSHRKWRVWLLIHMQISINLRQYHFLMCFYGFLAIKSSWILK